MVMHWAVHPSQVRLGAGSSGRCLVVALGLQEAAGMFLAAPNTPFPAAGKRTQALTNQPRINLLLTVPSLLQRHVLAASVLA